MASLSKQYQKKTDRQHILDAPDTYIGSVESAEYETYIMDETIQERTIMVIPGLYKLFDEGIVNCRDHAIRMKRLCETNDHQVSNISVSIDANGVITMMNDGNGIDVAEHPEYNIWIPELIFGHLRTSTNYDKTEEKIVGGKNGFGFKLVLIWSTWGKIETVDHKRKLKYIQEFKNNLDEICKPTIEKSTVKPYTKISFKPDYARLGINGLSDDMMSLFKRRIYDIAAVTDKTVKVKYNGSLVPVKSFQQYIDLYIGNKSNTDRIYEECNDRWEIAVCLSKKEEFVQVSFVNGIYTSKGGKHIEYVLGQIIRKLAAYIKLKKKIDVKPSTLKEQLMLFVRCDISNPSFDSQTKDFMNTPSTKFGSTCTVSDKFIEKIAKMGVMNTAVQLTNVKDTASAKKTDGAQVKNIRGITKLMDANFAGTAKSDQCTIILCEGDSAKAGIISGLSKEDRNIIGVYPLKGKLFNVRGETAKRIAEVKEINEIKQIMGLETNKVYNTREDVQKHLRYGKVLFMTDQDLDGSHIKGLCINLFQSQWNTLFKIPNFIGFMNTPILKAKKGSEVKMFYNDAEYNEWKEQNNTNGWTIKYYKGLGTSTSKEFKEYFADKKMVWFDYTDELSDNAIDKVFNKKRPDDRKEWLGAYDRKVNLDTNQQSIPYEAFIDRELIHFSKYDCDRSIPNLMDGLKISLRKILYGVFKKNLTSEIKVAQLSGYVSEKSGYHHGEASLNGAIIGMAQNFVGSNNINLLEPNGQFGTRLEGGKDSAAERYIFTMLSKLTRHIYQESDDTILKYLDDDGTVVEPVHYAPIIPMILVNGTLGIGTGFSSSVPCHNVRQIINWLKCKLNNTSTADQVIDVYYEGFKGNIINISPTKHLVKGLYEKVACKGNNKVRVTELPVGYWTNDFKQHLENLIADKKDQIIKDYDDMSTDKIVDFTITFAAGKLEKLECITIDDHCNGLEKLLKLYTSISTTNMHLFNTRDQLRKYNSIYDIIEEYYETRLDLYKVRKNVQLDLLKTEYIKLNNKMKYIMENLAGTIDLRRKTKSAVIDMLKEKAYDVLDNDNEYKYLVKMTMDSVTEENVAKLQKDASSKQSQYDLLFKTDCKDIWLGELNMLLREYDVYVNAANNIKPVKVQKKKIKIV